MTDYLQLNKANWNERAPLHAASVDYGFWRLARGPERLPLSYTLQAVKHAD